LSETEKRSNPLESPQNEVLGTVLTSGYWHNTVYHSAVFPLSDISYSSHNIVPRFLASFCNANEEGSWPHKLDCHSGKRKFTRFAL